MTLATLMVLLVVAVGCGALYLHRRPRTNDALQHDRLWIAPLVIGLALYGGLITGLVVFAAR